MGPNIFSAVEFLPWTPGSLPLLPRLPLHPSPEPTLPLKSNKRSVRVESAAGKSFSFHPACIFSPDHVCIESGGEGKLGRGEKSLESLGWFRGTLGLGVPESMK